MIRFDDILRMRQKELKHYLAGHLKKLGYETVKKKGFLYAEGTVPVLLVAHLDTVHNELPHIICRSEDGRYIMSPQGIGGDDRCGVYMILQIISEVRCHVLFCEDEETGGQGAKAFERSGIQIDVNYIVEVDRRGNNDAVFYNCDNPKFSEFVCSFGFREAMGSFSDISVVAPYLKTAAVNISAGYYNEHRLHEVIDWSAMQNNVERIKQMVQTETGKYPYRKRISSFRVCMCGEYACMRACACAKHSSIEYGRHRYACAPARRELRRSSASAVSDPKTKMGTPFTLRRASRNRWSSSAERATSKMAKQKSLCTT